MDVISINLYQYHPIWNENNVLKIQSVDTFIFLTLQAKFLCRNSVTDRISNFVYDVEEMTCELDTQKNHKEEKIYGFHALHFLRKFFDAT